MGVAMADYDYYPSEGLRAYGLSNNTPSLTDIMEEKILTKLVALCSSRKCAGGNGTKSIVKKVSKSYNNCPDCKHVLVWKYE